MMTRKRSKAEWTRRYLSFVVILFVIAFGTSLSIRANLGSSPISCPPYILSLVPGVGMTMGQLTICMHVFFIAIQLLLLRRNFERRQFAQMLVSFLFGFYTDLTMWITSFLQIPADLNPLIGYPLQFVLLLIGGAVLAFGIACEVRCDSLMLAGEGLPLAISKFLNRDFGKVKICSDTSLVIIGTVFMFIFFGKWNWHMVGIGTLVSMFYVGAMVRVFAPHVKWLDIIFIPQAEREAMAKAHHEQTAGNENLVVTIARTYGSGGTEIGNKVAAMLGCPCYSRQIIDKTAEKMGFTSELVAEKEQNISTGKLWEMIFTDTGIPASMNPSKADAIYVPRVLRVFITIDKDTASKRIAEKFGIGLDEAAKKKDRVDTGRANHCWHYTGTRWTDISGYDLVINAGRTGVDGAVDLILRAVKDMD